MSWLRHGPLLSIVIGYLLFLFGVAYWAERTRRLERPRLKMLTYVLTASVYCTAWTFYGSVGLAANQGLEFLTIYLGPALLALLWPVLLRRLVRIAKEQRITSISDFISSRYGKSAPLGALVASLVVLGLIVGLPLLAFVAAGFPLSIEYPQKGTFNLTGGFQIKPEFIALYLALSFYTASFIAEIVRAGILGVSKGQTEAAHSLGLRAGPTLRLVVLPQAMRIIIPPLTNQYLNLTKNSSLAVAIAYPDLVAVGGTVLNQTGQAVEIVSIWMLFYLGLSVLTSVVMGYFNKRAALIER